MKFENVLKIIALNLLKLYLFKWLFKKWLSDTDNLYYFYHKKMVIVRNISFYKLATSF